MISFFYHTWRSCFICKRVHGSVTGSSINLQTYAAMHHFISNNHSYSKPLIQLTLSSCLWQQLSHPAIQRNTAGVEKPSGVRYPPPHPTPLLSAPHPLCGCPRWQWQKSVIATSSDGFIKTSIVCAAERRRCNGEERGVRAEERRESPQCNYCIAVTGGASNPLCRWGPDACWGAAAGSHHFSPPLSLVGNDWIILQMNHSICLAHKHFLAVLIKTIKAEQSERIKKTTRLD